MAKKRFIRQRIKERDKPTRGRPAEQLSGDDVLGRRIPRGQHKKWWTCTNWRDREQTVKEGGAVAREYEWTARCACGARMQVWKQYDLPPVSGHRLPDKCDACNDRITGRDRAVSVDETPVAVSGAPAAPVAVGSMKPGEQVTHIISAVYGPLKNGIVVDLPWGDYSTAAVREAHRVLINQAKLKPPASMCEFLGLVAEPVVEVVAEPVAPAVVAPEPKQAWEVEADELIDRTDMNEFYACDWSKVDSRAIDKMVARVRTGARMPHTLGIYRSTGGKGIVKNG